MLLDKFQTMADFQQELADREVRPFGAVTSEIISATEGVVEGRKVILAGTNNYLGLSYDARCIKAAQEAAERWGTGTTGFGYAVPPVAALARVIAGREPARGHMPAPLQ